MKGFKSVVAGVFLFLFIISNAHAELVYQYHSSGQFGQTWGGNAGINVSVDGSGVNRIARLVYYAYSELSGYHFWYGEIPATAVRTTGVSSMAVTIDTCSVNNSSGCGYVDVSIATDEPASGWVYTGVNNYSWGDMRYQTIGNSQVRFSSAVGTVNGISVSSDNAAIGTYNNVDVSVSIGN